MAKVVKITDKLTSEKPVIEVDGVKYEVNDSLEVVFKFEEALGSGKLTAMTGALEIALGKKAFKELKLDKLSVKNFKVWMYAILAAMQDEDYETVEARFQNK